MMILSSRVGTKTTPSRLFFIRLFRRFQLFFDRLNDFPFPLPYSWSGTNRHFSASDTSILSVTFFFFLPFPPGSTMSRASSPELWNLFEFLCTQVPTPIRAKSFPCQALKGSSIFFLTFSIPYCDKGRVSEFFLLLGAFHPSYPPQRCPSKR